LIYFNTVVLLLVSRSSRPLSDSRNGIGVVFLAPKEILRAEFWIVSSLLRVDCGAD